MTYIVPSLPVGIFSINSLFGVFLFFLFLFLFWLPISEERLFKRVYEIPVRDFHAGRHMCGVTRPAPRSFLRVHLFLPSRFIFLDSFFLFGESYRPFLHLAYSFDSFFLWVVLFFLFFFIPSQIVVSRCSKHVTPFKVPKRPRCPPA